MSKELKIAIEAAKKGARHALKYFNSDIKGDLKEDGTIVTFADKETEEVIKSYISSRVKNAKFIGEESGGSYKEDELWVIDPIDGTRSYSRGIPTWCIIVSFCRDNDVRLSTIYYPISDTIYYAEKGEGAFEDKKQLFVSKVDKLKNAYLGFGSIRHFKNKQIAIELMNKSGSSRGWEATYSGCLVASGRMDAHIDSFGKIWDLAPFKVMVEEAGGKITRLDGSPWTFEGDGAIITNGLLHDEVLEIVNKKR